MAFLDYNRTIVGYHGTSRSKAEDIVRRQRFTPSENKHDWLGNGVYFWEHAPRQALWWAQRRFEKEAAVVGSMIRLGNCLDLLDPENARQLRAFHDELKSALEIEGKTLPNNRNTKKFRDCFVLEAYYKNVEENNAERLDSARGVYVPTPGAAQEEQGGFRLWERSWLTFDAHIQICIRPDAASQCILGTWPLVGLE